MAAKSQIKGSFHCSTRTPYYWGTLKGIGKVYGQGRNDTCLGQASFRKVLRFTGLAPLLFFRRTQYFPARNRTHGKLVAVHAVVSGIFMGLVADSAIDRAEVRIMGVS